MKKIIMVFVSVLLFSCVVYAQQMVEISVEITEINENKTIQLGMEWPSELSAVEGNIPSLIESGSWDRITAFSATLKALEANGAAKVLSKPKLITKSGTSARFMVGGEFPVVATGVGTSQVDWKEFGIIMKITPVVLGNNKIDIDINTELSRLDYNAPVAQYPSLAKRQASSHLVIKDGETMVLAGLIETTNGKTKKGIPFLCDIPILGVLFSTINNTETKTNVLIFVTPRLVRENR